MIVFAWVGVTALVAAWLLVVAVVTERRDAHRPITNALTALWRAFTYRPEHLR